MESLISARGLSKTYEGSQALDNIDIDIKPGKIVGLIGPNGAGKTTALKAILGLIPFDGELKVLGLNPKLDRTRLLQDVCFIADTAILPRWMKVSQAVDYMADIHPRFDREKAEAFIAKSSVKNTSKISHLSKGMTTQLHLALIMAINAKLLVLDEPTLGLDIIHRKDFYSTLLGEYFDHDKTIIVTTHQVEEIENILTDIIFIQNGKIILNEEVETLPEKFVEVDVEGSQVETARTWNPLLEQAKLGGGNFIFSIEENRDYSTLGKVKIPSIADLFLAKIKSNITSQTQAEVSL